MLRSARFCIRGMRREPTSSRARTFARSNSPAPMQSSQPHQDVSGGDRGIRRPAQKTIRNSPKIAARGFLEGPRPQFLAARRARESDARISMPGHLPRRRATLRTDSAFREAPRKLIASIPGVTLVELPESDLCCGSAGSYNLTEPAMGARAGSPEGRQHRRDRRRLCRAGESGMRISDRGGTSASGSKIKVVHLADFLATASR